MKENKIDISPEMLCWAVNRAGIGVGEYSLKHPEFDDWIRRVKWPTFKQLEKFAKSVYLPFGYLFFEKPVEEVCPIPFFRKVSGASAVSLNVYDLILSLQERQNWLSEFLRLNKYDKCDLVWNASLNDSVSEVANNLRSKLGLDGEWAGSLRHVADAIEKMSELCREHEVVVSFSGVVGNSTTRTISVDECRGFSLVDEFAPFIFINIHDSKHAQLFTFAHELAHLMMGYSSGIAVDSADLERFADSREVFCDKVAAEFLVPEVSFVKRWNMLKGDIRLLSVFYKVSEIVIVRRAKDLKLISMSEFMLLYDDIMKRLAQLEKKEDKSRGGGNFYATARRRISPVFLTHVVTAIRAKQLLYSDAYALTGLKGNTFVNLATKPV